MPGWTTSINDPMKNTLLLLVLMLLAGCSDSPVAPPVVPAAPSAASDYFVGALGCSMTRDVLDPGLKNYTSIDGWTKVAPNGAKVLKSYSGGTIGRWAEGNNIKWSAFESGTNAWPATNLILWQICIRYDEVVGDPNSYIDELQYIYNRMAADAPGVPIYVTGMPTYAPGHVCSITGPDGVAFSRTLAEIAAQHTGAMFAEGLDFSLEGPGQLGGDGCHASQAGAAFEANLLVSWLNTL